MDFILNLFSNNQSIFDFLFKLFAVVLSILYLIYAIILVRQTGLMIRAIEETGGGVVRFISFLHVILAVVLIVLSFAII